MYWARCPGNLQGANYMSNTIVIIIREHSRFERDEDSRVMYMIKPQTTSIETTYKRVPTVPAPHPLPHTPIPQEERCSRADTAGY